MRVARGQPPAKTRRAVVDAQNLASRSVTLAVKTRAAATMAMGTIPALAAWPTMKCGAA